MTTTIHIPKATASTRHVVETIRHEPDRSFRVMYAPGGREAAKMKFDDAENFARVLEEKALLAKKQERIIAEKLAKRAVARPGVQIITIPPPEPTLGAVSARGGRVLVRVAGEVVGNYAPEDAVQLAAELRVEAGKASRGVWDEVESCQTDPVKIKRAFGLPIVNTYQQYERLGDHTC